MTHNDIILVIDEEEKCNKEIYDILSDEYTVIISNGYEDTCHKLECYAYKINVIIFNLLDADAQGFSDLAKLHKEEAVGQIPVVVLADDLTEEKENEIFELGVYDIVRKPFHVRLLQNRIRNIVKLVKTSLMINQIEKDITTGMYTSNIFLSNTKKILCEQPDTKYVMIAANISRFKLVNELFGRDEGDKLLRYIGESFCAAVENEGICGYAGADNFYVLMNADYYNDELLLYLVKKINEYQLPINISIRFGVYEIEDCNLPVELICDRAKLAVDTSTSKYDACITHYDTSIRERMLRDQMITNSMKLALKNHDFLVYYQPKFDLATESVIGAEALVRWKHKEFGFLSPGEFIPLFEKNGFISELDYFVWEQVCIKIREWLDTKHSIIPISVNVSRVDLFNPKLPEILYSLVQKYKIPIRYLHLEITESAYTSNNDQIVEVVKRMCKMGFVIEMDDFGTGYSSLNMLSDLPIEILKLDMGFMRNNVGKTSGRSVIKFILNLAKWLGLFVVAEGVENQEQANSLRNMGCDYAQGYYYSKPIPEADFEKLLLETHVKTVG